MTSLLQKINTLDTKVDGLDSSNLQTQITTNTNDISTLQTSKQNTLIPGDNITITGDTISSSGGGSTIDSTNDLSCNTLDTIGDITCGGVITASSQVFFEASRFQGLLINSGSNFSFNNIVYNIGGGYNTNSNNFTCPVAGKYLFSVGFFANGNSHFVVDILINGSRYDRHERQSTGSGGNTKKFMVVIADLSVNDVVTMKCIVASVVLFSNGASKFYGYLLG